ncbi:uncharacterized protein [Vicugna pacos]|uniref:Collagen alpha-1(I) chain-like n=1 Tax=Vicugna pacos TaxID=30538 RepID=A0ABM5EFR0_VICPA
MRKHTCTHAPLRRAHTLTLACARRLRGARGERKGSRHADLLAAGGGAVDTAAPGVRRAAPFPGRPSTPGRPGGSAAPPAAGAPGPSGPQASPSRGRGPRPLPLCLGRRPERGEGRGWGTGEPLQQDQAPGSLNPEFVGGWGARGHWALGTSCPQSRAHRTRILIVLTGEKGAPGELCLGCFQAPLCSAAPLFLPAAAFQESCPRVILPAWAPVGLAAGPGLPPRRLLPARAGRQDLPPHRLPPNGPPALPEQRACPLLRSQEQLWPFLRAQWPPAILCTPGCSPRVCEPTQSPPAVKTQDTPTPLSSSGRLTCGAVARHQDTDTEHSGCGLPRASSASRGTVVGEAPIEEGTAPGSLVQCWLHAPNPGPGEAGVWTWLPDAETPVVKRGVVGPLGPAQQPSLIWTLQVPAPTPWSPSAAVGFFLYRMFTAALLTIAKTWKQAKCPWTDDWIKKM